MLAAGSVCELVVSWAPVVPESLLGGEVEVVAAGDAAGGVAEVPELAPAARVWTASGRVGIDGPAGGDVLGRALVVLSVAGVVLDAGADPAVSGGRAPNVFAAGGDSAGGADWVDGPGADLSVALRCSRAGADAALAAAFDAAPLTGFATAPGSFSEWVSAPGIRER